MTELSFSFLPGPGNSLLVCSQSQKAFADGEFEVNGSQSGLEFQNRTAVHCVYILYLLIFQVPDGFISHFYVISEHVSPVLAFGFLGPRQHLSEVCAIFKVREESTWFYSICHRVLGIWISLFLSMSIWHIAFLVKAHIHFCSPV